MGVIVYTSKSTLYYFSEIRNFVSEAIDTNELTLTLPYVFFCFQLLSTVFVSAVLNLAELVGLSDVVRNSRKILYFHENQLVYPVRKQQDRDFQHGYNQIISW